MAAPGSRIAPHLHMPMQSGDDGVLAAMNRWYTAGEYLEACARIRAALDRPAFSADVLVGFPGEDERAFANTLAAARAAGFARIHAFPFSARPGTAAEGRPSVAPEVARERRARLGELACELGARYRAELDGSRDSVLLEGGFTGLSGRYQRVRIDPAELAGLPEGLFEVELEADGAAAATTPNRPSNRPSNRTAARCCAGGPVARAQVPA